MKRYVKRLADIAKVVGIVCICVAVVLSIYVVAVDGSSWRTMRDALESVNVKATFPMRLSFDGDLFRALSAASADKTLPNAERAAKARACFADFETMLRDGTTEGRKQDIEAGWQYFDTTFDAQAFLETGAQAENGHEAREVKDIFEYLDGLTPAPKGKAAKLKKASSEPWFREQYDALTAEHGEEVGSWLDYMRAVQLLAQRYVDGGGKIKDLKAWYGEAFDWAAYAADLETVRGQERQAAETSVTERVAAAIESGEGARSAVEAVWSEMKDGMGVEDELAFLNSVTALLGDENYDGTVKTLRERMADEKQKLEDTGVDAFMSAYADQTVANADDRAMVGIVSAFWRLVSWFMPLWIIGIALVLLSFIVNKLLARYMLNKLDRTGIQEDPDVLLRVEHLCQYFRSGDHVTKAVDDVSFFVKKGEVFGLVGESGCGKTTTGRTIINLYDPTAGDVYFDGLRISSGRNGLPVYNYTVRRDAKAQIAALKDELKEKKRQNPGNAAALDQEYARKISDVRKTLSQKLVKAQNDALESEAEKGRAVQSYRQLRRQHLTEAFKAESANLSGQALEDRKRRYELEMKAAAKDNVMTRMQMIFQDPIASIDPRMTVREIIAEGLHIRGIRDKKIIDQKVYEMLDLVGLVSEHADRYPHEFSGGQRQRIGIARAIALEPELIIADEPISALDVSIQAQVINLLNDLRKRMGLTIIFIAHNLSVVKYFSDRIAVMYFGNIVEMTTSEELFRHPLHPYTKSLLSAIPYPDPHYEKRRKRLEYNPERVHDYSVDKPTLREIIPGHWIRCNDAELEKYRRELGL